MTLDPYTPPESAPDLLSMPEPFLMSGAGLGQCTGDPVNGVCGVTGLVTDVGQALTPPPWLTTKGRICIIGEEGKLQLLLRAEKFVYLKEDMLLEVLEVR